MSDPLGLLASKQDPLGLMSGQDPLGLMGAPAEPQITGELVSSTTAPGPTAGQVTDIPRRQETFLEAPKPRYAILERRQLPPGEISPAEGQDEMTQFFRRTGITQPGVLPKIFGAAEIPFEALNTLSRAAGGYRPGEGGPGYGDVVSAALAASAPWLLEGGLPLEIQRTARTTRLLKESPALKRTVKDIREAYRRGEGGLIDAEAALKEQGIGRSQARIVMDRIKQRDLLDAVQTYQGTLRDLASGGKTEAKVFEKIGTAKLAEDGTFNILRSIGVPEDSAKVFIRHFAMERTAPLETIERLAKTPARKLAAINVESNAITNPFLPIRGDLRTKLTKAGDHFLIPESVMSLDQNALRVHNNALETYRAIDQSIYQFQQRLDKLFGNMTTADRELVGRRLDNAISARKVPARINKVADLARNQVLETLANWNNLKVQNKYLKDYFPWIFDRKRGNAPHDLLQAIAQKMAKDSGKVFEDLSKLEQGKLLDVAYKQLKKNPKQYFFGNISLHRMSDKGPVTYDAFDALNYYVHGAVRKYYMDRFYDSSRRLLPEIADPDLQKYTLDYIHAFRGLTEGKGRRSLDTVRSLQAWAKLGLPNLTSPLLNLSQTSINTYSIVGAPTLMRALALRFTPEGSKLLKQSGVFLDVAKHEMSEPIGRALQTGSQALLFLFNRSEQFNREIAWLSGYLKAQDRFPKADFSSLNRIGRQLVDRTQFVFSSPGRPAFYRTPIGAAAGQFKLFGINQLRFISSLKGAERSRFAVALALHGGMKGLPGTQTLMKTVVGMQALQWVKDQELPDIAKETIAGGLPRAMGVSLEHDIGVGFVPTSAKELLPPGAGPLVGMMQGVQGIKEGDIELLNRAVSEGMRNIPGGVGLERWRQAYLAKKRGGLQFSPSGDIIKGMGTKEAVKYGLLGGKSSEEVGYREQEQFARESTQRLANARKMLRHELRLAAASNNVERATQALQQARDAGVLDGVQVGEQMFYPVLLDRFMSAPPQVKIELWNSDTYRGKMMDEVQVMSGYTEKAGGVLKEAGSNLMTRPAEAPKWPYKGSYSNKKEPQRDPLDLLK